MSEVINFNDIVLEHEPHEVSEVICLNCLHRWIGVMPVGLLLKDIECPYCSHVAAVIKTGQTLEEP